MSAVILQFPQRHRFNVDLMMGLIDMEARRPGIVQQIRDVIGRHDDPRAQAYVRELGHLLELQTCGTARRV